MKKNYLQLIEDMSTKMPDKVVLKGKLNGDNDWKGLSYSQLWQNVEKLGEYLISLMVKEHENVAIISNNMPAWIVADLAVMSIRAVTVPLYPTLGENQIKYILDEAESKIIFVGEQSQYDIIVKMYGEGKIDVDKIIVLDPSVNLKTDNSIHFDAVLQKIDNSEYKNEFQKRLSSIDIKNDIATLIYTSGTTGEPKGVMIGHNNILKMIDIHDKKIDLTDKDTSLAFLPLSHVFERGWSWFCLFKGAESYQLVNPKDIAITLPEVAPSAFCSVPRIYEKIYQGVLTKVQKSSFIKRMIFAWALRVGGRYSEKIRLMKNPSLLTNLEHKIADKLVFKNIRKAMGGNLRIMPTAGAHVPYFIVEFFHSVGIPVLVGYGLSETSATVSVCDKVGYELGSIGKPMPDVEVKIGKDNEILVKADTVMHGYYKKPQATAEVFDSEGWFKTGDAGYIDENGNLFITERIKDLMKTSQGKYIAPQLIESKLLTDTLIEQAIVVGDSKPYVTAIVVPNFQRLKEYAKTLNLSFSSMEELINLPKIKELYEKKINELQKGLSSYEMVKRFTLLSREFSMELGELTPTLKIKRKIIMERLANQIQAMYMY